MYWFLIVLLAGILLLLLLRFQQGYEQQGTNALLRETEALRDEVGHLKQRVEHLEVIAAQEDEPDALEGGAASDGPVASDDSSSVSLDRPRDRS